MGKAEGKRRMTWISPNHDEQEVGSPRNDPAWLGLEGVPHPALAEASST